MRELLGWQLVDAPDGVVFANGGAGFSINVLRTASPADRTTIAAEYGLESAERGQLQVAGLCEQEAAEGPLRPDETAAHLTCIIEYLHADAVVSAASHRVRPSQRFHVIDARERPVEADRVRVNFTLSGRVRAHLADIDVSLEEVDASSALADEFRRGYAWPGTPSMRWLAGKSMYVCAGCELTYVNEFIAKSGLRIYHTFKHQEAMDPVLEAANPDSEMWRAHPDFMILSTVQHFRALLSRHERARAKLGKDAIEASLDDYVSSLAAVVARIRETDGCPIWIMTLPYTSTSALGAHDYRVRDGSLSRLEIILQLKLKLLEMVRQFPAVFLLDPDLALEAVGKGGTPPAIRPHETLGGHPERRGARYIAEYLHHELLVASKEARRFKCVVVDCDNTLWQGVIREDGPSGIKLNRTRMQRLWHLGLRGIPIAVCSKNDPEDEALILDTIRSYSKLHEMIVATRFNWLPKSQNVRSIAEQLNVGLDAVAYFDDNAFERHEVASALPEVSVYPETAIGEAPDWHSFQPYGDLTPEAADRVEKYRQEGSRATFQATFAGTATGFEEFLHQCQMRLEARLVRDSEISRAAELLQRTNQLNATLKRLEVHDVQMFHRDSERAVHIVKLGDRFGDYGMIGTALSERRGARLHVVELALSCRAMGRRVEDALLEELIGFAADAGMDAITIDVTRTSRNHQIIETLERVGFAEQPTEVDDSGPSCWYLDIATSGRRGRSFAPWFSLDSDIGDLE